MRSSRAPPRPPRPPRLVRPPSPCRRGRRRHGRGRRRPPCSRSSLTFDVPFAGRQGPAAPPYFTQGHVPHSPPRTVLLTIPFAVSGSRPSPCSGRPSRDSTSNWPAPRSRRRMPRAGPVQHGRPGSARSHPDQPQRDRRPDPARRGRPRVARRACRAGAWHVQRVVITGTSRRPGLRVGVLHRGAGRGARLRRRRLGLDAPTGLDVGLARPPGPPSRRAGPRGHDPAVRGHAALHVAPACSSPPAAPEYRPHHRPGVRGPALARRKLGTVQPILHLSIPVRDMDEACDFYVHTLGCQSARTRPASPTSGSSACR